MKQETMKANEVLSANELVANEELYNLNLKYGKLLAAVLSFKEMQVEQLTATLEVERNFLRHYPNCKLCGYNDEKEFLQGELYTLKQWIELFNLTFKGLI